ncbi:GntR family transcriptional regulator [Streptomyces kunmingensis]|uniref:GntR family transcriptional regulator n=1 Tax=Streptomyces kunmingensis TaxID=68225 RepID=A0ABU6C235_9ACTN|nr:GntR family transcriptional regulator [Streptomyces kunmingensis]MEB3958704.1 GntR family transcriptional regulator [Streptomyces kunmingensis]
MNQPTVRVDTSSPVPPYEQVRLQLADLILGGHLAANDRLPAVRQLAADLGLAAGTVARAYRELEAADLVISRSGAGTRVTPRPARSRETQLAEAAHTYIADGRRAGATDDQLLTAVRIALSGPSPS